MNGILNVYKQKGHTSHDVVDDIRHKLHVKKAGHAGTLDPEAEGVLPVCVGKSTKLSSRISDSGKTYRAVMLLGVVTDTQDMTGTVLSQNPVNAEEDEVKAAAQSFVGPYDQIPPMYSARKVKGKKLYELAREGVEVERQPRRVEITSLTIDDIALPRVTMTVTCTKGTYIRALCSDIGEKLGCGACMESLIRTRVGSFLLEDSLTARQIEEIYAAGHIGDIITPPDEVFPDIPDVWALPGTAADKLLHNGNPVRAELVRAYEADLCGSVRMYDSGGKFIGIYLYSKEQGMYRPDIILN